MYSTICPGTQASHLKPFSSRYNMEVSLWKAREAKARIRTFQHQAGPRCHRTGPDGSKSRHHPSNDALLVLSKAVSLAAAAGLKDMTTAPSICRA
jgi:hypothetical protein